VWKKIQPIQPHGLNDNNVWHDRKKNLISLLPNGVKKVLALLE